MQSILTILAAAEVVASNTTIEVVKLFLTALGPLLAAATIYYTSKALSAVKEAKQDIVELKENVNGKMGELLKVKEFAAHAAGANEQRAITAAIETAVLKSQTMVPVAQPPVSITRTEAAAEKTEIAAGKVEVAAEKTETAVGALTDSEISKMIAELNNEMSVRRKKKV